MDGIKTKSPLSLRERDTTAGMQEVERRRKPKPRVRESETLLRRSRVLRKQSSDAEQTLWRHLRDRRLNGYKFRRQVVIEPYIVDFACFEARLIIEADGGQHTEQIEYDALHNKMLESMGYIVLRFWNNQILNELPAVLEQIDETLVLIPSPQPSP